MSISWSSKCWKCGKEMIEVSDTHLVETAVGNGYMTLCGDCYAKLVEECCMETSKCRKFLDEDGEEFCASILMAYDVDVLGTIYHIVFAGEEEYPALKDELISFTDTEEKEIVLGNGFALNHSSFQAAVIRHEVLHAFIFESGLGENARESDNVFADEEVVDWFALQFPKLMEAYDTLGVLE